LPEKVGTAVIEFAHAVLAESPHRAGGPLHLELLGLHAARRGDYRIIYEIDDRQRRVTILAIGHRAHVYRRRR
jgi:mRNA interferase RelE/StbE